MAWCIPSQIRLRRKCFEYSSNTPGPIQTSLVCQRQPLPSTPCEMLFPVTCGQCIDTFLSENALVHVPARPALCRVDGCDYGFSQELGCMRGLGKAQMVSRLPRSTDTYVGSRVRLLRIQRNLTQQGLAERLGVSFQQIQKYEKGANRISASRLQHLSQIFDIPLQFFFDGAPRVAGSAPKHKDVFPVDRIADFVASVEGRALAGAFSRIEDTTVRRSIVHMVEALAKSGKSPGNPLPAGDRRSAAKASGSRWK